MEEINISIREATTRWVNITCLDKATDTPFDFTGYDVQTWVKFGTTERYVQNTIAGNLVSYKIPAELSLGTQSGLAETRIFKDGDVYEVLRVRISVHKAGKPDMEWHEPSQNGGEGE